MRIWSIHPSYLDAKGLVACWRETLLAQSCLMKGEFEPHPQTPHTRLRRTPYYNHPQLKRFKRDGWKYYLGTYLYYIWEEGNKRGYNFDKNKIQIFQNEFKAQLTVTKGQLEYEFNHLQNKLWTRDNRQWYKNIREVEKFSINIVVRVIEVNPIFQVIDGQIESWEKTNA